MAASITKLIVGRFFVVLTATLFSFQIFSCDLMVVLKETTLYKDAVDKPSGKEIANTVLAPGTVLLPSKAHSTGHVAVIFDNCLFVQHWAACEFQDSVTKNGRTEVICLVEDNKWKLGWIELNDNVIKGTYQDRAQLKSCAGGPPKQILDPSCYLTAAKTLFDSGTLALQKKQELASLIEKATNGQQDAQYELGIRYYYGINNDLDTAKGIEWLSKAGEGGYLLAQNKLASLFSTGDKALPQDKAKALYWTIKSAEQGQTQAMALAGKAYLEGIGTAKDFSKAFEWTKKAAEAGDVASENMLGVLYHNGQGTEKNVEEAKKWWLLAANQGSKEAKQNWEYVQKEQANKAEISQSVSKVSDIVDGQSITLISGLKDIFELSFSNNDQTIIARSEIDHVVKHWDLSTGELKATYKIDESFIDSVKPVFSSASVLLPSGDTFWLFGNGERFYDLRKQTMDPILFNYPGTTSALKITKDYSVRASIQSGGANNGLIYIQDLNNNSTKTFKCDKCWSGLPGCFVLSNNGDLLIFSIDDEFYTWWWRLQAQPFKIPLTISSVYFSLSPDNSILALPYKDNSIIIYNLNKQKSQFVLKGHSEYVLSLSFSPDSKHLASSSTDGSVRLWDLTTGTEIRSFKGECPVKFSNNGSLLAWEDNNHNITVWKTQYK
ncbi:MAG TPA: hypothetical protein PLQ05_02855 [Acidobacteriota bacterium]|nr:hypothetical protein [Acidobacteriota bacterium]HQO21133.1 hypothetical protein [Acidobacteriota bacterium]